MRRWAAAAIVCLLPLLPGCVRPLAGAQVPPGAVQRLRTGKDTAIDVAKSFGPPFQVIARGRHVKLYHYVYVHDEVFHDVIVEVTRGVVTQVIVLAREPSAAL